MLSQPYVIFRWETAPATALQWACGRERSELSSLHQLSFFVIKKQVQIQKKQTSKS